MTRHATPTPLAPPRTHARSSESESVTSAIVGSARGIPVYSRESTGAVIVGFDGSLTAFGWSVVDVNTSDVLAAGCVCTKPDPRSTHQYQADKDGARVDTIAAELLAVLADALAAHPVVLVAIEAPAGAQHAASAKALGLAYGIARTVCAARALTPITVQAHEVKSVVGGSKGASKDDVAAGVKRLTGWASAASTGPAREGATDAVGVALTAMRHPIAAALRARP